MDLSKDTMLYGSSSNMPSIKVDTKEINCMVSSDADCGVTKDFGKKFLSKVTTGDVCTAVSNKTLTRIPEFNLHCLLPKCTTKLKVDSRGCTASDDCCGCGEKKVGQNSASPSHHSVHMKEEPSVTSSMNSDAPNVTPMSLEQVIPDLAFVLKTICENPVVIQSIMVLLLSCHPELAFDKVTLELAAFREFMLLKLNKDRTDELAAEAISLYQQRQNRLLSQKETVSYQKNREDRTCETVQCHIRPVLSNTHFVPNQPSCCSNIAQELIDHKKALSQIQLSQRLEIQLSENCVQSVNLCQIPVTSSMLNSVTANVSTDSHSCMVGNSVEIKEGQNKNCEFQSRNLMPRASLECGKKIRSFVQCSVRPDLCQKDCQASVNVPELDSRKIDSLGNRFQSVLNLPLECNNSAAVQTSTVSGISCVPTVYSQQNKSMATGCSRVMSKSSVVTQFLPGKISQNDDFKASAQSTCSLNYLINQQELSFAGSTEAIKMAAKSAFCPDFIPSLMSNSQLCLQEFDKAEPKAKEELNVQEIIHPSFTVIPKTESWLQRCMPNGQAVIQPPEVTDTDAIKIQTNLNRLGRIPKRNIISNSNVSLACQNNIEKLGISSFDNQKTIADRNNLEDIVACPIAGFGERIGTAPRFQFRKELLGDQRASATDDKPGLNLTNFDATSFVALNNVVSNAGQVKLLNESSKVHSSSFERKGESSVKQFSNVHNKMKNCNQNLPPRFRWRKWKNNSQENCSQEFRHDQPFRNSGCVKPSAEYKEVGKLAEHSTKLTAKNGNWSMSGHPDSNGLSHLKKSDVCRTDFQGLVKHEIAPNSKGLCYQQSQNVGIASGRPYILHFSHAVSSEHSMCNCHKKQDLDVFCGFSDFDLRPELRKVISELDFEGLIKVQRCCLRPLLDGLDVICAEGSGSGKTTLLALSTLQHLQSSNNQVAVLVLCHTYKAMVDVYDCFRKFSAYIDNVRVCILNDMYESSHNLQRNESQILIGSVQSVLRLTYIHPDLFLQLKHFVIEDCDVLLKQTDVCKNIEKIAEFMPQEKQVILICRKMFPFIGNMFKKLVPYEVNMTTHSF